MFKGNVCNLAERIRKFLPFVLHDGKNIYFRAICRYGCLRIFSLSLSVSLSLCQYTFVFFVYMCLSRLRLCTQAAAPVSTRTLFPPVQHNHVQLPLLKDTESQTGTLDTDGATTAALPEIKLQDIVTTAAETRSGEKDAAWNANMDEEAASTAEILSLDHNLSEATAEISLPKGNDEPSSLAAGGPLLETTVDGPKPAIIAGAPSSSRMDVGIPTPSSGEPPTVSDETSPVGAEVETAEIDRADGAETEQGEEPPVAAMASVGLDEIPTTSISDKSPDTVQDVPSSSTIAQDTTGDEVKPDSMEEPDVPDGGNSRVALERDAAETAGANELALGAARQPRATVEEAVAEHAFEVRFTVMKLVFDHGTGYTRYCRKSVFVLS